MHFYSLNYKESYILKVFNIIAIIIDVIWFVILQAELSFNSEVIAIHSVALICSILYHFVPTIRSGMIFKFISHTIATLMFMLLIVNIYEFVTITDGLVKAILFVVIIFITAPCSLVNVTLLLLLNFDTSDSQPFNQTPLFGNQRNIEGQRFVYVPQYNQEYMKYLSLSQNK